jgi:LacI family transcriptional regulator
MPSSLSDVAKLANVSLGTASSVLTARKGFRVSPDTAARIREAAEQLDYRANRLARALATGKSRLVGLVDYDVGASFSSHLGGQFHRALAADGYDLAIFDESTPADAIANIVDGAICCSRGMPPGLADLLPVVHISPCPNSPHDALHLDMAPGAKEAMALFAQAGCQRIAYLGCDPGTELSDGRLQSYQEFVDRTGREGIMIVTTDDRRQEGFEAVNRYAEANGWPDAVFCRNDDLAFGVYRAARESGLVVGKDVLVIGCDDICGEYFDPPLTTLALPFDQISEIAWRLLQERIESSDLPPRVAPITAKLIVRSSASLIRN